MSDFQDGTVRLVLVGKSGNGKSATANTILGENKFLSEPSDSSVTTECQKANREWKGKNILVVDTPGLFNTQEKLDNTCKEISRCVVLSAPGPHVIILVLQMARFTEEEQKTFAMIKAMFGESVTKHMIILFTHKEDLEKRTLSNFLAEADVSLKSIIKECGNRCCAFNNKAHRAEKEVQVQELMQLIEKSMCINGYFSDNIYQDIDQRLKRKVDTLVKIFTTQLEKEIQLVEEECVKKTYKEKEEKIKLLKEQHATRIRKLRAETGEYILADVFKMWYRSLFEK